MPQDRSQTKGTNSMSHGLPHPHTDPDPPRRPVPRLWRTRKALALSALYGDLDTCELADLRGII